VSPSIDKSPDPRNIRESSPVDLVDKVESMEERKLKQTLLKKDLDTMKMLKEEQSRLDGLFKSQPSMNPFIDKCEEKTFKSRQRQLSDKVAQRQTQYREYNYANPTLGLNKTIDLSRDYRVILENEQRRRREERKKRALSIQEENAAASTAKLKWVEKAREEGNVRDRKLADKLYEESVLALQEEKKLELIKKYRFRSELHKHLAQRRPVRKSDCEEREYSMNKERLERMGVRKDNLSIIKYA